MACTVAFIQVISTQMGSTNWLSPIWSTPNTIRRYIKHNAKVRALLVSGMLTILHSQVWTRFLLSSTDSAMAQWVFSPSEAGIEPSSPLSPAPPSCTLYLTQLLSSMEHHSQQRPRLLPSSFPALCLNDRHKRRLFFRHSLALRFKQQQYRILHQKRSQFLRLLLPDPTQKHILDVLCRFRFKWSPWYIPCRFLEQHLHPLRHRQCQSPPITLPGLWGWLLQFC